MSCDACGRIGGELFEVNERYRSKLLGHICTSCKARTDKYIVSLWKITRRWETRKTREFLLKHHLIAATQSKGGSE